MSLRYYVNAAPQLQISSLTSGATSLSLAAGTFTGWPVQFPFYAALDKGTASVEIVSVTSITGTTAVIVRGQDNTSAIAHPAGATLDFVVVAKDFREANDHINATAGVHGVSGSLVGTTDVQALTNKTLTSPAISNPTVTGTSAGANATLSGTLGVTGATTLAAVTASGAAHLTAAGTALAVDHDITVGGAATVAGNVTSSGSVSAVNLLGNVIPTTYANAAARDAAITVPVAGTVVYLTTPGLHTFYEGGAWKVLTPSEADQAVNVILGATAHTPGAGTATWVTIGNVNVPTWAGSAVVTFHVLGSNPSSGSALNVNAQVKIGTAGGVSIRIPGSTNTLQQAWGYTDVITAPPTGTQSVTVAATFNAGTGTFDLQAGSIVSARVTFLP